VVAFHSALPYLASQSSRPFAFDAAPYRWIAFPIVPAHAIESQNYGLEIREINYQSEHFTGDEILTGIVARGLAKSPRIKHCIFRSKLLKMAEICLN